MADVIEWALKLKDQFSAPGKAVITTVDGIKSSSVTAAAEVVKLGQAADAAGAKMRSLQALSAKGVRDMVPTSPGLAAGRGKDSFFDKQPLSGIGPQAVLPSTAPVEAAAPKALRFVDRLRASFGRAKSAGKSFYDDAAAGLGKVKQFAFEIEPAVNLAGMAVRGVGSVVGQAVNFGTAVVQAQAYKEDVTRALTIMLKSKSAAESALKTASKTADLVGTDRAQVAGQFVDLLAKGFDVPKVDEIVRSLADLSSVDPRADLGGLTRVIGQIASTGRLQGDELNELANAGLETGSVYQALAKSLNKTVPEVIKLKEAGKITSDTAIAAILSAINQQAGGGKPGDAAAAKARENISGLLKQIDSIPKNLFYDLAVNPALSQIKDVMNGIIDFFKSGSKTGELFSATVADVFDALVTGFLGVKSGGDITKTFTEMLEAVRAAKPQIAELAANLRRVGDATVLIATLVLDVYAVYNAFNAWAESMGAVGTVFKVFAASVMWPFVAVWYLIDALVWLFRLDYGSAWGSVSDFFSSLGDGISAVAETLGLAGSEIGTAIVDGISRGVTSGATAVITAITGVATNAIDSAKRVLGIASPSKVFEQIGDYTSMGFVGGITANDNAAGAAISSMVEPPSLAGITAGASAAGEAIAGGGGGSPIQLTIQVDARGASAADAQAIADIVAERLVAQLENLGLGLGAVAA